jgi:hypothetical protein
MAESLEQWGPRPRPITLDVREPELFRSALAEGRGLVVPTAHFGGWEVGARFLSDLGRPVNLVMAHEPNPTVRAMMHRVRTRLGFNVIYSDSRCSPRCPSCRRSAAIRSSACRSIPGDDGGGSDRVLWSPRAVRGGLFAIARVAHAP